AGAPVRPPAHAGERGVGGIVVRAKQVHARGRDMRRGSRQSSGGMRLARACGPPRSAPMCANTLAVPVSRSARRPRRLGALLGCALIAPAGLAQSFSPLHGLPGTPTVGAFDPHRQRPIVATSGMTGQTDLWEWSGAGWQRRAGEAQLPLLDPMLVTD